MSRLHVRMESASNIVGKKDSSDVGEVEVGAAPVR